MTITSRSRNSLSLVEWDWRDGLDANGLPVVRSGQALTFDRGGTANTASATDQNGRHYVPGYKTPRYHFIYDTAAAQYVPVGLLIEGTDSGHAGDTLSIACNVSPCHLTLYVRLWRGARAAAGSIVAQLGTTTGVRLTISEHATYGYVATFTDGTTSYSSYVPGRAVLGDFVELRCVLDPAAANVITLCQSMNEYPESSGSASGALATGTLPSAWGAAQLVLGSDGTGSSHAKGGYMRAVVDAGTATLERVRANSVTARAAEPSVARLMEDGTPRLTESGQPRYTE